MSPEVEMTQPGRSRPAAPIPLVDRPMVEDTDMVETPDEMANWPALVDRLRRCSELISPVFHDRDAEAKDHQRYHRLLTTLAAVFGTGAVLFAILQLAYPDLLGGTTLEVVEVVAVVAALAAVVMGVISGRQSRWLLERHKAERLRLAKFRFLIDPATWSDRPEDVEHRVAALRAEVDRIQSITSRQFREWTEQEDVHLEPHQRQDQPTGETRDQLVDYYRTKRLLFQRDIFRSRAKRHDRWDRDSRRLGPILFLGSVSAVLVHFGIDLYNRRKGYNVDTTPLILLAAGLPVAGAGIRTLRTAYEFARNTSRYRAKSVALDRLDHILKEEQDPQSEIRLLGYSEELLEFEHHEWCRLMIEAEWLP